MISREKFLEIDYIIRTWIGCTYFCQSDVKKLYKTGPIRSLFAFHERFDGVNSLYLHNGTAVLWAVPRYRFMPFLPIFKKWFLQNAGKIGIFACNCLLLAERTSEKIYPKILNLYMAMPQTSRMYTSRKYLLSTSWLVTVKLNLNWNWNSYLLLYEFKVRRTNYSTMS